MISDDALAALKERNPVDVVASQWVALRTRRRGKYIGPCPLCSEDPQSRSAMRFECDSDKFVCAVCREGGDVIKLVMKREGVDFKTALDRLGGARDGVLRAVNDDRDITVDVVAHRPGERVGEEFEADRVVAVVFALNSDLQLVQDFDALAAVEKLGHLRQVSVRGLILPREVGDISH